MLEKLKKWLAKTVSSVPDGAPLFVVVTFAGVLVAEILLINAGWIYNWYDSGKANVPVMIDFLTVLVGAQFTTAVMLIGKGLVDKDGDGIPDALGDGEEATKK